MVVAVAFVRLIFFQDFLFLQNCGQFCDNMLLAVAFLDFDVIES
jgi:hypothetical protein